MLRIRKTSFMIVGIVCISSPFVAAQDSDATGSGAKQAAFDTTSTTEVILLGTLHGLHDRIEKYSLDILQAMIVALKPSAILVELPPTINGQPTIENSRVSEGFSSNEGRAANQAAESLGVDVIPYDRAGRNEFYKETHYFEREKSASQRLDGWLKKLEAQDTASVEVLITGVLYPGVKMCQSRLMRCAGPEIINSSAFDLVIANKLCIVHRLWPKMLTASGQEELAGEFLFFRQVWEERNQIMAANIQKIARGHIGKRLVVLCGAEHRYILREILDKTAGIRVREFYDLHE